jgi:hypothetical protein
MRSVRVGILTVIVASVIGAALGFWAGRQSGAADREARATSDGGRELVGRVGEEGAETHGEGGEANGETGEGGATEAGQSGAGAMWVGGERVAVASSLRDILDQAGPMDRWKQLMAYAESMKQAEEIEGAIRELNELPPDIDTYVARFFLYSQLADDDPEASLARLEQSGTDAMGGMAAESILSSWAGQDAEAAAAYLMTRVDDNGELKDAERRQARSIANEWARTDPEAAMEWSLQLDKDARGPAAGSVLGRWANQNPAAAVAFVEGAEAGDQRKAMMAQVAGQWARSDAPSALAWAQGLDEEERKGAVANVLGSWAQRDLEGAARKVPELEAGEERDQAMGRVAGQWAMTDAPEAAAWVKQQEVGNDASKSAMRNVMRNWAGKDEFAAAEWLAEQSPGPATDGAIIGLTERVAGKDPESAAFWAVTISDPKDRANQLSRVGGMWVKKDRAAATAWLTSHPDVPAELRDRLLSQGQ